VRDEHTALDIVQDAMTKLAEKYSDKPLAEMPMLFQRILQNTIRDHFRRQKVRSFWTTPLSSFFSDSADEDYDPLESFEVSQDNKPSDTPATRFESAQVIAAIEEALLKLPARQREAFLLRYWEEMDVAETAAAMGCAEGSVKTHCSRAVHSLVKMLKEKGITL
jgi:RNA polymerase sigma-70 factor, ECF subfamily